MGNVSQMTDEQLVSQYIEGNDVAFNILLERYESKVFTYIIHYVKSQEVAEDLFQDTFMRVISTLRSGRYTEQQKFGAWLLRVAHNQSIDYLRQARTGQTITEDDTDADLFNDLRLADNNNIERQIIEQQTMNGVESIIHMLPANQQQIIKMRYYDDLSFREIADMLGISINTALGRVRYALINLRKMAQQYGISRAS